MLKYRISTLTGNLINNVGKEQIKFICHEMAKTLQKCNTFEYMSALLDTQEFNNALECCEFIIHQIQNVDFFVILRCPSLALEY